MLPTTSSSFKLMGLTYKEFKDSPSITLDGINIEESTYNEWYTKFGSSLPQNSAVGAAAFETTLAYLRSLERAPILIQFIKIPKNIEDALGSEINKEILSEKYSNNFLDLINCIADHIYPNRKTFAGIRNKLTTQAEFIKVFESCQDETTKIYCLIAAVEKYEAPISDEIKKIFQDVEEVLLRDLFTKFDFSYTFNHKYLSDFLGIEGATKVTDHLLSSEISVLLLACIANIWHQSKEEEKLTWYNLLKQAMTKLGEQASQLREPDYINLVTAFIRYTDAECLMKLYQSGEAPEIIRNISRESPLFWHKIRTTVVEGPDFVYNSLNTLIEQSPKLNIQNIINLIRIMIGSYSTNLLNYLSANKSSYAAVVIIARTLLDSQQLSSYLLKYTTSEFAELVSQAIKFQDQVVLANLRLNIVKSLKLESTFPSEICQALYGPFNSTTLVMDSNGQIQPPKVAPTNYKCMVCINTILIGFSTIALITMAPQMHILSTIALSFSSALTCLLIYYSLHDAEYSRRISLDKSIAINYLINILNGSEYQLTNNPARQI